MKRRTDLPELLAPAGDMDALQAAVAAGADAVYVGGKSFGARAFAKNFDIDELSRAVRYCHLFDVRLYVTVNTLLFDKELSGVGEYIRELYRIGVDAIIVQDLAVMKIAAKVAPKLELHASTQMSIHNTLGADVAYNMGAVRVVLARELSLADIKSVVDNSAAEVEVFLHGALCVCHSGQCLFSSLVGGRSGNRGECAQPCRLPYNSSYPLSLKDLSLSEHIKELIDSGVSSLKIEGRMKSPSYVFGVTSIYRRLLDEGRSSKAAERERLAALFSRGGFTDGYFRGKPNEVALGIRSQSDKDSSRLISTTETYAMRLPVRARVKILRGAPCEMTLYTDKKSFTAEGDIPAEAISSPLTRETVAERLSKTGATYLSLKKEDIELELDTGLNLSVGALNALRRAACEGFESAERESDTYDLTYTAHRRGTGKRTALFLKPENMPEADSLSYFDVVFTPLSKYRGTNGVYLPPVIPDSEIGGVREMLCKAVSEGAEYALVGNLSHLALAAEYGLTAYGDIRLNITNGLALEKLAELGVELAVLSAELSLPAVRDIGGSTVVYGRIPLMLTEKCFMREGGCERCERVSLTDRTGAKFPIMREYKHRNLILNCTPTYMADKKEELKRYSVEGGHFIFSIENKAEITAVISAYRKSGNTEWRGAVRRIGTRVIKTSKKP